MAEQDALSGAKFGSGLYLNEFPARIRILTRDPMVYNNNNAQTKYAFAIYNLGLDKVQILDKGYGVAKRLQEINSNPAFGGDIRKVDLQITTNGKSGTMVRYTIDPCSQPSELLPETVKTIVANGFDLAQKIKKNNPSALRLSEINAGAKLKSADPTSLNSEDTVIEDVPDEFNLDDIPF